MSTSWATWRPFPIAVAQIEAPEGPGVYEVRDSDTGETVAFDHSDSIAIDLARLHPDQSRSLFETLFRRKRLSRRGALEFRVWPAANKREAKTIAASLRTRRDAFVRRRRA
jgi:hypothetical protein